jgi:hypothetical protein
VTGSINWWHLYSVTFSTFRESGRSATYDVVTDRGPLKAVVIASGAHRTNATWSVFDVELVDHGVIEGGPGGTAKLPDTYYDDRKEW